MGFGKRKNVSGDERTNSGVKPSVEVKRPDTPEPIEVEDLIDQKAEEQQPNPQATPQPAPKVDRKSRSQEDIQMKKALELLQEKTTRQKAAGIITITN